MLKIENSIKPNNIGYLGKHLIAEFYDCNENILSNVELIEEHMLKAVLMCNATVVAKCFHKFLPYGVSGVVIIAESHLAVHTWPEFNYAAVDFFTCGNECNTQIAYEYLKEAFNSKTNLFKELYRGQIDNTTGKVLHLPVFKDA